MKCHKYFFESLWLIPALFVGSAFSAEIKPLQDKPDLVYEMKQGDTLLALVAKYFSSPEAGVSLCFLSSE